MTNSPPELANAINLVRSLIETRSFRKERLKDDDVGAALAVLGRYAQAAEPAVLRLDAVSTLAKAGAISKPIGSVVHDLIKRGIQEELPCIGTWGNADDRFYLAKGVSVSNEPWIAGYAAREFARAELSEKLSRNEWANIAINRADNLGDALNAIGEALAGQLACLSDSTDMAYRKLIRIFEALTQTILTADIPTGDRFGKAFTSLIRQGGGGTGAETLKLRAEAAGGALDLLIQILRLRFETIFDSDIFRAVGTVRSWWRPGRPPEDVEQRAERIARLAVDGLHILARQGVKDVEFRRTLVSALGQERINAIGQLVASKDLSLDPGISKWLATGLDLPETKTNVAVQELNDLALDELVAQLLLTLHNQDANPQALKVVADEIDVLEPNLAAIIRSAAKRAELVEQWVHALAAKRMLSTYGKFGELVTYDPTQHESRAVLQRMAHARVVAPGVIRRMVGVPAVIISKAIVEKP